MGAAPAACGKVVENFFNVVIITTIFIVIFTSFFPSDLTSTIEIWCFSSYNERMRATQALALSGRLAF